MNTNTPAQHHLRLAHHHGLVIGTLVGSVGVSLVTAIAVVVINPALVLHPLDFTSFLTSQPTTSSSSDPLGPAANQADQPVGGPGAAAGGLNLTR